MNKTLDELISDLTPEETAELLTDYKPNRKETYMTALQAARQQPTDRNIIKVLLLKPYLIDKLVK
jgi:hypothetical protein